MKGVIIAGSGLTCPEVPLGWARVVRRGFHLYEGDTTFSPSHFQDFETVILTSCVGAISDRLWPGDIMLVGDHINLTGTSPLSGPDFVDMKDAYSQSLLDIAEPILEQWQGRRFFNLGTYAQVRGPQYETPAEVRMLRTLGADVVGMSMALETIAARSVGAEVLGIAVVTNRAGEHCAHEDVLKVAHDAAPRVETLIRGVVDAL